MKVTGLTRVKFILAHPVAQVVATHVLNQRFEADGLDIVVVPLHVKPDDLAAMVDAIRRMHNVVGFGVTIPHKIAIVPLLDGLTERARRIGSVNAVRRNADGTLLGDNLDGQGFVDGMVAEGLRFAGRKVVQLGAGGAGRAVAFALADAGAGEIVIHNRSPGKAGALAAEVGAACPGVPVRAGREGGLRADIEAADVIVNTTSVGLRPEDGPAFDFAALRPGHTVADIIMVPEVTPLLDAARRTGCTLGFGKFMLKAQYVLVRELLAL